MLGIKRITGAADLAPEGEPGSWVSDAAREKFMAAYERAFALWPQPREEFDIETATATTRVHAYRPHPGGDAGRAAHRRRGQRRGLVPARGGARRGRPGLRDRHARRREPQRPARPDDSPGVLRGLAGRAPGQAQRPPGAPGRLLLRRLGRHEPGDPRARAGRLHHAARPRRAHQARRPLLVVALHQRPGHPDPDAAAPPPRPVAGQPGHAAAGADDAHVGSHPRLPMPSRSSPASSPTTNSARSTCRSC